eukprot:gene24129-9709_t
MRPTIGLLLCVFLSVFSLSHAQVAMDPQYQAAVDTAAAALAVQKQPQQACPPMSKEVFAKHAREGVVLITVVDHIVMKKFGESFVQNIMRTNISYWFVAALDPWTSLRLGSMGPEVNTHCFNAPQDKLGYKGSAEGYVWGSNHWRETTWNKVHVLAAVYELGFCAVNSNSDTTWFNGSGLCATEFGLREFYPTLRKATPGAQTTGMRPLGTRSTSLPLLEDYAWGSNHWRQTTWNKVHVLTVYELGVHAVHSDSDTTC